MSYLKANFSLTKSNVSKKLRMGTAFNLLSLSFLFSGVLTTTPAAGSLGCLLARQLCTEDSACNQILQVIPRVCGLELGE